MNKTVLSILALVVVAGVGYFMFAGDDSGMSGDANSGSQVSTNLSGDNGANTNGANLSQNGVNGSNGMPSDNAQDDGDADTSGLQDRPATEIYRSAQEAFAAIKNGATNYDDIILEQFTELGPDCTWCDELYKNVKDSLASAETPADQKSYFAEVLAISGKVENIKSLIDAIEDPARSQDQQILMEALELTIGKDDVVKSLNERLATTQNADLKESMVAAISNQGSPLAVESLYKFAVDSNNPDGFYSEGTGLGEVIPDADSFGPLKDIAAKKDDYSHLAVKALLNGGVDGLKAVVDLLSNSTDAAGDEKVLKDAIDHLNYDEETEKILKDVSENSKNPVLKKFAKDGLDTMAQDAAEAESAAETGEEDQVSTPMEEE